MKTYRASRIIAGLLTIIGWLIIFIGLLVAVFAVARAVSPNMPSVEPMFAIAAAVSVATCVITGILALAAGEMISALVDIAINSASLPQIARSIAEKEKK